MEQATQIQPLIHHSIDLGKNKLTIDFYGGHTLPEEQRKKMMGDNHQLLPPVELEAFDRWKADFTLLDPNLTSYTHGVVSSFGGKVVLPTRDCWSLVLHTATNAVLPTFAVVHLGRDQLHPHGTPRIYPQHGVIGETLRAMADQGSKMKDVHALLFGGIDFEHFINIWPEAIKHYTLHYPDAVEDIPPVLQSRDTRNGKCLHLPIAASLALQQCGVPEQNITIDYCVDTYRNPDCGSKRACKEGSNLTVVELK